MTIRAMLAGGTLLLLLGACGGADPAAEPTGAEDTSPVGTAAEPGGTVVAVSSTDLGEILVDGEGRTLYVFDADTDTTSTCYDDCASNWPALEGPATAGEGIDEALLSTTDRDDGTVQVTYNDRPLYLFAGDAAPGDTNGQGVGDAWWVVAPDGSAIEGAASADDGGY